MFVHDYRFGHAMILRQADEVVIERSNGLRYRVDRARCPWTATPITLPDATAVTPRPQRAGAFATTSGGSRPDEGPSLSWRSSASTDPYDFCMDYSQTDIGLT
ncbi:hypothetical protein GCM10007886_50690 [Methylobacterium gregans]|uniref:hypothetical protein n=1 Tax=Methylobacterium gregans TaxID=374424 RepID=UPI001EE30213|nr:hypothetical protein [Methylobacterium gregans]GLS56883.1 hypothetical protein GCM10007886_50690 [Methylobacterium gregans]